MSYEDSIAPYTKFYCVMKYLAQFPLCNSDRFVSFPPPFALLPCFLVSLLEWGRPQVGGQIKLKSNSIHLHHFVDRIIVAIFTRSPSITEPIKRVAKFSTTSFARDRNLRSRRNSDGPVPKSASVKPRYSMWKLSGAVISSPLSGCRSLSSLPPHAAVPPSASISSLSASGIEKLGLESRGVSSFWGSEMMRPASGWLASLESIG